MNLSVLVLLIIPQVLGVIFLVEKRSLSRNIFKAKYRKNYTSVSEECERRAIFYNNEHLIRIHNANFARGQVNFTMSVNKFADMTAKEFQSTMTGLRVPPGKCDIFGRNSTQNGALNLPPEVDWTEKETVSAVKDQKRCGSCWAFSATGSLEHFIKTKKLVSLSEQNLLDCDKKDEGCDGGFMDNAFNYIKNDHGEDTEESYRYQGFKDKCPFNPKSTGASLNGFVDLPCGDEVKLMDSVANVGPVSIGIDTTKFFQFYEQGILNDPTCSNSRYVLDHAVLAVGYGTDQQRGGDYWLVKNSWGTS